MRGVALRSDLIVKEGYNDPLYSHHLDLVIVNIRFVILCRNISECALFSFQTMWKGVVGIVKFFLYINKYKSIVNQSKLTTFHGNKVAHSAPKFVQLVQIGF